MQRDIVDGRNPNYLLGFDRWPDFPTLARRAKNGCKFCEFVRGTLQSLRIDPQEFGGLPVLISLRFLWGRDNLVGIAVMLHRGIDPTGASVGHRKEFYIESMDGMRAHDITFPLPLLLPNYPSTHESFF